MSIAFRRPDGIIYRTSSRKRGNDAQFSGLPPALKRRRVVQMSREELEENIEELQIEIDQGEAQFGPIQALQDRHEVVVQEIGDLNDDIEQGREDVEEMFKQFNPEDNTENNQDIIEKLLTAKQNSIEKIEKQSKKLQEESDALAQKLAAFQSEPSVTETEDEKKLHNLSQKEIEERRHLQQEFARWTSMTIQQAQMQHRVQKKPPKNAPVVITKKQGQVGFNREVRHMIVEPFLAASSFICTEPKSLQMYQRITEELVRSAHCKRLLVAHRVGSGKTAQIIALLDEFYDDPRPKMVLFPLESQIQQTLVEMLLVSNWGDNYLANEFRKTHKYSDNDERLKDPKTIKKFMLDMGKGIKRGIAPVIFMKHTLAGGAQTGQNNNPKSRFFKPSYAPEGYENRDPYNPFDNKIVIIDEFHNLPRPNVGSVVREDKLKRLRELLLHARDTTTIVSDDGQQRTTVTLPHLYGFTGTPTVDSIENDLIPILDIVRGQAPDATNYEGYLSYFNLNPLDIYPQVRGVRGLPETAMPEIKWVDITEPAHVKALLKYPNNPKYTAVRAWGTNGEARKRTSNGEVDLTFAKKEAPKIAAVIEYLKSEIVKRPSVKTLVMMNSKHGLEMMALLMTKELGLVRVDEKDDTCGQANKRCLAMFFKNEKQAGNLKKSFSDDRAGTSYSIALVDSNQFGEGIDFKAVRRFVMVDVPDDVTQYTQWMGRFLRLCSQFKLEEMTQEGEDNLVDCVLFAAKVDPNKIPKRSLQNKVVPSQIADEKRVEALEKGLKLASSIDRETRALSIEGDLLYNRVAGQQENITKEDVQQCRIFTNDFTTCASLEVKDGDESGIKCQKICKQHLLDWLSFNHVYRPLIQWPNLFDSIEIRVQKTPLHAITFKGVPKVDVGIFGMVAGAMWKNLGMANTYVAPDRPSYVKIPELKMLDEKYTWTRQYDSQPDETLRFEDIESDIFYWNNQYRSFQIRVSLLFKHDKYATADQKSAMMEGGWTVMDTRLVNSIQAMTVTPGKQPAKIYRDIQIGGTMSIDDTMAKIIDDIGTSEWSYAKFDICVVFPPQVDSVTHCKMIRYHVQNQRRSHWRCEKTLMEAISSDIQCPTDHEMPIDLNNFRSVDQRHITFPTRTFPTRTFIGALLSILQDVQDARNDEELYVSGIKDPVYDAHTGKKTMARDATEKMKKNGWKEVCQGLNTNHYKWFQ